MVIIVFYRFLSFVWYVTWCFHYFIVNGCCFELFYLWQILIFHISDRQADRHPDRQTDRRTDRERQRERQRQRETERNDCHPTWTNTISAKSNLLMKNYSCRNVIHNIHWYSGRLVTPVRHYYDVK